MYLLKALLASAVLVICSGETMEDLSQQISFLFKVYEHQQKDILDKIAALNQDINDIDVTRGTCGGKVDELKSKFEDLEYTMQNHCQGRTESLSDFSEVLRSDECTNGEHNCHANAICTDLLLGFKCACPPDGFTGDGLSCQDVNECAQRTHRCHSNANCNNLLGSYSCECNPNYYGDGRTCSERKRCRSDSECKSSSYCKTLGGNRYCFCRDGYLGNGISCADVNECTEGQHQCDEKAACKNVPGSYSCTCKAGFQGDGKTCQDANECVGDNRCHQDATCSNNYGSYSCSCNSGFQGNGYTCEDVDECEEGLYECQPNSSCNNIRGSYSCICNPGYESDGDNCKDIDECLGAHDCHVNAMCNNTEGSYKCYCHIGYRGDGHQCEDMCPHERVDDVGCIFFEHGVARTWLDARDNCEEEGGRLFSAVSPHSLSKLQQYLVGSIPITIPDWTGLWLGIYDNTWLGDNGGRTVSTEEWVSGYCPTSGVCCGYLLNESEKFSLYNDPCDSARISICQWNETSF